MLLFSVQAEKVCHTNVSLIPEWSSDKKLQLTSITSILRFNYAPKQNKTKQEQWDFSTLFEWLSSVSGMWNWKEGFWLIMDHLLNKLQHRDKWWSFMCQCFWLHVSVFSSLKGLSFSETHDSSLHHFDFTDFQLTSKRLSVKSLLRLEPQFSETFTLYRTETDC